ncbi:hypothetical protein IWW36_000308 [Coemansia brasiliensis]|uniref:non-specific serine/threonine protein kinase n=1 Tax=Coemansia brasiliensis TaxID=2650707 RepID=A0A9W8IDV6_9FUNG|nr:hypothetical protein IWW36_000308 [Coemansia brasiliensis]
MDFARSHTRLGTGGLGGPQMVKTYGRHKQRIVTRETKGAQEFARATANRMILADILDSSSESDFEECRPQAKSHYILEAKSNKDKENMEARMPPRSRSTRSSQHGSDSEFEPPVKPKRNGRQRSQSKPALPKSKPKATRKSSSSKKAAARSSTDTESKIARDDFKDALAEAVTNNNQLAASDIVDSTVDKVVKQQTQTTSVSIEKPRTANLRTKKKTASKVIPQIADPPDTSNHTAETDCLPVSSLDEAPSKDEVFQTNTVKEAEKDASEAIIDSQEQLVSVDERLAAVAQSPLSSGRVARRKPSRIRRSVLNHSAHSAATENSPAANIETGDLQAPTTLIEPIDNSTPAAQRESDISRRLSQVSIREGSPIASPLLTVEPTEDAPASLTAFPDQTNPIKQADECNAKLDELQIFSSPIEPCAAEGEPGYFIDDNEQDEQSRQHLATRAMRFKAPRNARAQTYEIDDVPETNHDGAKTPPRRFSTEQQDIPDSSEPDGMQSETQQYPEPLSQDSFHTPVKSRQNSIGADRPRMSLAATQLITKRSGVDETQPAVPHSPSRIVTPHRVVYSPTRPQTTLRSQSPKRKTINGTAFSLPPRLPIENGETKHRASLPASRLSLSTATQSASTRASDGRAISESINEPEIEETTVPFLPARRYVQKAHILAACGQTAPIDWVKGGLQACGVLLPPLDPSQYTDTQMNEMESDAGLCKIGEATYSEVFSAQWRYVPRTRYDRFNSKKGAIKGERLMQVALKVIPFGNSSVKSGTGETQTTLRDLYQEIGATLALSRLSERERGKLQEARMQVKMPLKPKERELGANFVKAFRVCICQGPLPDPLLRAWDRWKDEYPDLCENARPDYYPANQLFAVFVLEMGGETLENAAVSTWKEARSIIRQLALSMALAERNNRFEHRDLHWGNIMVTRYHSNLTFLYQLPPTENRLKSTLISIPSYKVRCTIIDYTLSRLHIDNDACPAATSKPASYDPANNVFYVALKDEALFQGEGDIQFDVYRQMRACAKNDWQGFHPQTNVLWLTYVLQKILTTKSPGIRDELMAFAESKLGPAFENMSADVKRAASQEMLRRWMREFEQCESSSQVLQCALLDLYKN